MTRKASTAVREDDALAAGQASITNVVAVMSFSFGGGGLIQTTSG
jgi:hypothetical protein